jgi:hypothetical protein
MCDILSDHDFESEKMSENFLHNHVRQCSFFLCARIHHLFRIPRLPTHTYSYLLYLSFCTSCYPYLRTICYRSYAHTGCVISSFLNKKKKWLSLSLDPPPWLAIVYPSLPTRSRTYCYMLHAMLVLPRSPLPCDISWHLFFYSYPHTLSCPGVTCTVKPRQRASHRS